MHRDQEHHASFCHRADEGDRLRLSVGVRDVDVLLLAFGFAGGVEVFFGFYPARKAAGLNPIDALRYE